MQAAILQILLLDMQKQVYLTDILPMKGGKPLENIELTLFLHL